MKQKVTIGKIWGLIYPMLIYVGVTFVITMAVTFLITFFRIFAGGGYDQEAITNFTLNAIYNSLMQITLISAVATIPIMLFFIYRDVKQEKLNHRYVKYEKVNPWKYLFILPFAYFNMIWANIFVGILQMIMPDFMLQSYETTGQVIYQSGFAIQLLTAGIAAPIVEELIFRGLIYKRLTRITNIRVAAIFSAFLFGLYHGNWVQAPYAIIFGLVCVYVYEKYKSLAAPCVFHIATNTFATLMNHIMQPEPTTATTNVAPGTDGMMIMCLIMIICALFAFLIGFAISKIVNPKEISE